MSRVAVVVLLAGFGVLGGPAVGRAGLITFSTTLSGAAEAPPNASPGTGFTVVEYDTVAHTMRVRAAFSGLIGPTTVAHIHSATAVPFTGTAGVATPVPTFPGFPSGVTAGEYDRTFDLTLATSYNPAFLTARGGSTAAAEAFLVQSLGNGTAYMNVHSQAFPGGEIRGFFVAVPEPTSLAVLAGVGALGLLARVRRRAAVTP